ncbi:MAG: CDP-alcohol phosphatidyltransferase family protein [Thermoplasmata archaeon]|nr:MAG: CDP-alcohol phosphatidyltransferase family protein [Thermoplasmata archaeon]RLF35591.1 MAG: CDP-alcohol phosphatidyltransferase family protein [Thermoplasmata archaeon]RLF53444.1 MAG: CDP-alcohol phosphatidyltransferase family protein [Thermoplasmata archaeon]
MVLDKKREDVDPLLSKVAKYFTFFHPNVLSGVSLFFAFLAGLFFFFSSAELELSNFYLYVAVFFVFLNGFFDAVDGKVAKLTNKTSKKGDFLDHAVDRYADVFMVGGLALSSWCDLRIGFFAVIGMLLTSYMGTQAQAVGYKRDYSGLLGRADRLVLLMVTPLIQHILLHYNFFKLPLGLNLLEWVLVYFAVMGNVTAIQRFYSTLKVI